MPDLTLYFAQHGLAVDKADDPARPLSVTGSQQTNGIANLLRSRSVPVANIFHSGKLRAEQTAEIFATELHLPSPQATGHFSPNDDVSATAQILTTDQALYIGHLPHIERLLAYLLTGDESNHTISFRNSAVACLQKEDDSFRLNWYITPELAED